MMHPVNPKTILYEVFKTVPDADKKIKELVSIMVALHSNMANIRKREKKYTEALFYDTVNIKFLNLFLIINNRL